MRIILLYFPSVIFFFFSLLIYHHFQQNTALQVAACAGRVNVVTFLLDRKTAITKNNLGISVFRMAIESRHRDVAMAIIMNDR